MRGVLEGRGAARTHLARAAERDGVTQRDLGLLTELVYGVVRRVGTLDALLMAVATGGLDRADDDVLAHLRVAAYQLVFLEHVPPAVAVSEAVEAAGRPQVRGYVNGVLRALGRLVVRRVAGDAPPAGVPAARRVPGRTGGWVVLARDVLPDAAVDPAGWLAAATSLPRRLAQDWLARHGEAVALELARAAAEPPPLALRVNPLRTTREDLLARLAAEGTDALPGDGPQAVRLPGRASEAGLEPVLAGLATVQDETAQAVAPLLEPHPGERLVDLCAAPGGKATHLAELLGDRGRVDALDVAPDRVRRVVGAARRLGLGAVVAQLVDPADPRPGAETPGLADEGEDEGEDEDEDEGEDEDEDEGEDEDEDEDEGEDEDEDEDEGPARAGRPDVLALADAPIDGVLVDAPCSNTGVLRRRVEVRWRLDALDWPALLALQARLLARAVDLVRPGGRVVYSTCSIDPRENEEQVRALLAARPDVTLELERTTLPARGGGDGGYAARLRKGPAPG